MNLKAIFPAGVNAITVTGLTQWDYGRKLEIQADDLPAVIEVHFACPGMDKAVVRSCQAVSGVATAVIPDQCLEQSAPVVAWVYEIDGTTGATTKTVTMPVTPRAQPQPGGTVPTVITDKYTELVTAVNEAVAEITDANVAVVNAQHATTADEAETAEVALYASADKSKGTIEARLTALGFKDGAVTPAFTGGTVESNYLSRQGKYVIGSFEVFNLNLTLVVSGLTPDLEVVALSDTLWGYKIGQLPSGFEPKDVEMFHAAALRSVPPLGSLWDSSAVYLLPDGSIVAALDGVSLEEIQIHFGYEAA